MHLLHGITAAYMTEIQTQRSQGLAAADLSFRDRFAPQRIECNPERHRRVVTDNSYLDNPTFRGMHRSLMQTFDDIYLLDLHSNSNKKARSPDGSEDKNVFDIKQGVAIC